MMKIIVHRSHKIQTEEVLNQHIQINEQPVKD